MLYIEYINTLNDSNKGSFVFVCHYLLFRGYVSTGLNTFMKKTQLQHLNVPDEHTFFLSLKWLLIEL